MVHVMPWSPNKVYHNLIKHNYLVWVEVVNFPNYMRPQLATIAFTLGQVICKPQNVGNKTRFCILWNTDRETPSSIAIEIDGINLEEKYFKLKWGVFEDSS